MIKAITPKEANSQQTDAFPEAIIESTNELIALKYRKGRKFSVKFKEIIQLTLNKDDNITRDEIFDKGWLDIETIYENQGWEVTSNSPSYREDFDGYFEFNEK